jgi:hypothetical protein
MPQIDIPFTRAVQNTAVVQQARAAQARNQISNNEGSEKSSLISKFARSIINFFSEMWTNYQTNRTSIRSSQALAENAIMPSDSSSINEDGTYYLSDNDEFTNIQNVEDRIQQASDNTLRLLREIR